MRKLGLTAIVMAAGLALAGPAIAQNAAAPAAPAAETTAAPANEAATANATAPANATAAAPATPDPLLNADGSQKTAPVDGVGQPIPGLIGMQEQVTPVGTEALRFHNWVLMPLIIVISVFVLLLLLWTIVRYRRAANPVPSKTSHNTAIEVVWTLLPVLILVAIAVPSIRLLAHQFEPAPAGAVTIKAIGNQWFWSYEYPDHGDIQLTANMLKEKGDPSLAAGARYRTDADGPALLATDTRIILPYGVPIRLIATATDVIHAWAMPAFWTKIDAVPGKLNETSFIIEKPGVYFGQCSELCGKRHGYMPIVVQAVSPAEFEAWVKAKGGTMPVVGKPSAATPAQPGSDAADDTTTPANGLGPVVNATEPAANSTGN